MHLHRKADRILWAIFIINASIVTNMNSSLTGIVLAGGRGTRLRPLTNATSKQLLNLGGKPMIVRVVEKMSLAGITSVIVVLDERHGSEYLTELRDGSALGVEIVYVWQDSKGGGIPSAILQAKKAVKTNKLFVACGDVMIDADLSEHVRAYENQELGAALICTNVEDSAGYSVLSMRDNRIDKIHSKDSNVHHKGLIDLGMYFYQSEVFDRIPKLPTSGRGETEVWDLNNTYIKDSQLIGLEIEGWWSDAGLSIEEYLSANRHYETTK